MGSGEGLKTRNDIADGALVFWPGAATPVVNSQEARINHDAIDQILDDRCNAVDTAEAFVEGCLWSLGGHTILLS